MKFIKAQKMIYIHGQCILVPKDAKEGERFYIEDVIDDIVAERFWGSIIRAKDGVGIWNGRNLEIDTKMYDKVFMVG
jgi:hypothetical protein